MLFFLNVKIAIFGISQRRAPYYSITIVVFLTNPIERAVIKNKDELRQIKERYNEAYAHAAIVVESRPSLSLVHVTRGWLDERIALRESGVCKLLAQGFSTSEIGAAIRNINNSKDPSQTFVGTV